MKRMIICFAAVLAAIWSVLGVTVTNVRGEQRQGSKLVDIYYDLNSTDGGTYTVEVALEGGTETVQAVSLTGDIGKGVKLGRNRHVVWDAGIDWVSKKGYIKVVVTAKKESAQGVQLWEGGLYWADRNIGADEPWEYGYYFWWGDTIGYKYVNGKWVASNGSNSNFSFDAGHTPTYNKGGSTLRSEGWITSGEVLSPQHDAAHVHWGGNWRMPTFRELVDLLNNCDWMLATMNGVNGYVVRGKDGYSSASIFLPCAGYGCEISFVNTSFSHYWASNGEGILGSYSFSLNDWSSSASWGNYARYNGFPVRPIRELADSVYSVTGGSDWFYVNTADVKVRLVATEGVLVDEDGNPVKDENGKFITEVTQEFPRNRLVPIMKNPFKRGNNIFLGWSRDPDVDLIKEVYENRKSLEEVLYSDEDSLYFDIENAEEEVTLYAIWTVSLTCSFSNVSSSKEDLKNHLYWQCLGLVVDGKPEEYWSNCRDGESVELLPGSHDIYFGLKEGYSWIVDELELLRMKKSILLPSASSSLLPPLTDLVSDHTWRRSIEVDVPYVKSAQTGSVKFQCIPESSRTLGYYASLYPFDLSKVTIKILPLYSNGLITKPIVIKNGEYVTFPAGEYMAKISYDNSGFSGDVYGWYATEGWSADYCGFEVELEHYIKVIPVNFALGIIVDSAIDRKKFTVTFDPQKGKVDVSELTFMRKIREDINQPEGNAVITYLPEPVRENYKFLGWWTKPKPKWWEISAEDGVLVKVGDEITGDCTLYARWANYGASVTVDGDKLTGIMDNNKIITVSHTIHFVSASAFELVEDAEAIVFAGDAPEVEEGAFEKLPSNCTVYVKRSSSGWGTDIPGVWKGVKIEYIDDVIPTITNELEIKDVFKSMTDGERLVAIINDIEGYGCFRKWALYLDERNPLEVKDSPNAWLSYALDTDALITVAPKEGDIVIDTFESAANDGVFEFTVKIDGITVGENALGANIRKVFGIEGAETLARGGAGFSSDSVEVNTAMPENGNAKFIVTPKAGNGEKPTSFFFRVKMK